MPRGNEAALLFQPQKNCYRDEILDIKIKGILNGKAAAALKQSLITDYGLRTSLIAITLRCAPDYQMTLIYNTNMAKYGTIQIRRRITGAKYGLRSRIAKSLTTIWNLGGFVTKSLTVSWKLYGEITKSLTTKWDLRAKISKTLTLSYHLLKTPITKKFHFHLANAGDDL